MRALILVDLQNDFMPGGALAVPDGDQTVPVANALLDRFDLVVATQDWHPKDHSSFITQHPGKKIGDLVEIDGLDQVVWPVHCVRNTSGAEFHKDLNVSNAQVFHKGTDTNIDSYSGFFDNGHKKATGLGVWLLGKTVDTVYILGLAMDYCVKYTALDAVGEGFKTYLVEDGCRGVGLEPGDVAAAIDEMKAAGVEVIQSSEV